MDYCDESRSKARCQFPQRNYSTSDRSKVVVYLRRSGEVGRRSLGVLKNQTPHYWDGVEHEASLASDAVIFLKGLKLLPHKISDLSPTHFQCHFSLRSFNKDGANFLA
jgi:hypothetical protein